jgi:hypothetical protein
MPEHRHINFHWITWVCCPECTGLERQPLILVCTSGKTESCNRGWCVRTALAWKVYTRICVRSARNIVFHIELFFWVQDRLRETLLSVNGNWNKLIWKNPLRGSVFNHTFFFCFRYIIKVDIRIKNVIVRTGFNLWDLEVSQRWLWRFIPSGI